MPRRWVFRTGCTAGCGKCSANCRAEDSGCTRDHAILHGALRRNPQNEELTPQLRRGRGIVVAIIVGHLLINTAVNVYSLSGFSAGGFLFLLYLLYILYQGAKRAPVWVGGSSALAGIIGVGGLIATAVRGTIVPLAWFFLPWALWEFTCAGALFFSPSVRAFLGYQRAHQAPLLRKRAWLIIPIVILSSAADVTLKVFAAGPEGLPEGWLPTLLQPLVAGLVILIVWLLSKTRQPDGTPRFNAQQRFPLPLALGFCAATAILVSLWGGYRYYVEMPAQLRGTWRRVAVPGGDAAGLSAVATDQQGNVWFATDNGLSVLDPAGQWTRYRAADGLGADDTMDVLVDRRGRVWVSTAGGLSRFDGTIWQTFTLGEAGELEGRVWQLALDGQGNVWFLSLAGLSVIHPDDSISHIGLPPDAQDTPGAITVDAADHIWVLTMGRDQAIAEYDPLEQRWVRVEQIGEHVASSEPAIAPHGIAADREAEHLWIAASTIVELDGDTWRVHEPEFSPSAVLVDADGYIWFGSSMEGLLLLSPDRQQWWHYEPSDRGNGLSRLDFIQQIVQDASGNYWFIDWRGALQFVPDKP